MSNTIRLTKTQDIAQVKRATYEEFERLRRDIDSIERQGVMTTNYYAHMSKAVLDAVDHEVKILYTERNASAEYYKHCWWQWPANEFFDVMNNRFRLTTSEKSTQQDFLDECRSLVFEYRNDSSGEAEYAVAMGEIAVKTKVLASLEGEQDTTFTTTQRKDLFKSLITNIRKRGKGDLHIRQYIADKLQSQIAGDREVWLLRKFIDELRATTSKARKTFSEVLDYTTGSSDHSNVNGDGNRDTKVGKNKRQRESKRNDSSGKSPKKARPDKQHDANKDTPTYTPRCTHCNSKMHAEDKCQFVNHPDYILKGAWRDSDVGLAYKTLDPKAPYIKPDRKLNKDMTKFIAMTQAKPDDAPKSPKDKAKKGNVLSCCADCDIPQSPTPLDDVLIPVTL